LPSISFKTQHAYKIFVAIFFIIFRNMRVQRIFWNYSVIINRPRVSSSTNSMNKITWGSVENVCWREIAVIVRISGFQTRDVDKCCGKKGGSCRLSEKISSKPTSHMRGHGDINTCLSVHRATTTRKCA
jgi:hypothetical protein